MYIEFKCFAISLHCKICRVNHHFAYVGDISVGEHNSDREIASISTVLSCLYTVVLSRNIMHICEVVMVMHCTYVCQISGVDLGPLYLNMLNNLIHSPIIYYYVRVG